ncbi:MAG TPA: T9SS type A sorting domain-containing protein [bacterium]|jgi:hypothetical protein
MKRWITIVCLIGALLLPLMAQSYSISGRVTGGQSNLLMLKYVAAVPLALDSAASLLQNITFANPFNSRYTLSNLDSGGYFIIAFQDIHQTIPPMPQPDDPRGFYGENGIPSLFTLRSDTANIDLVLDPPNTGGFSGRISYAGNRAGITYIQAFNTATFDSIRGWGIILDTAQTGSGDYVAVTDTFGTYYARAFIDLNGNFTPDADEPFGIYGGATPAPIHVLQSNFPDSVNIVLVDRANTVDKPAAVVPADAELSSVYPNPFNNSATITFRVATAERIELTLYDLLGRQVAVLAQGSFSPGEHRLTLDGSRFSSGAYYVHLNSAHTSATKAVILLK